MGGAGVGPGWPLLVRGPPGAWCAAPPSPFLMSLCTSPLAVVHHLSPSLLSIALPYAASPEAPGYDTSVPSFSDDSSLWATMRYSEHVRKVSSTRIPYFPSSQASSRFLIRRQMAWYAVTCQACCRITVWKTMNRCKFHCLSSTPRSSSLRVLTNRLPTFLLGAS